MLTRILATIILSLFTSFLFAEKIKVSTAEQLKAADKKAKPGDEIILQNGDWYNVTIELKAAGTKEMPVTYSAETKGKVRITGHSQLKLGGDYIVVDGLVFTNGFAGEDAVIDFRINKKQLANHCRVTNTVINSFNNPKRMDENYWISFSGRNNRLDHCSFLNKTNMGVLIAVILDDEKSRENHHSIDHNYFGVRLPLASNTGEMIRVGVSQYCEYNSFTNITGNYFYHCDGETEIVSIKSGGNVVQDNVFEECQGSVVLRHGNENTVTGNVFLGNDKEGTGGVRVINRGQWVIYNFFYKCRGVDFRSPLAIMNGVPNSPANRYVEVTDALIASNTFWDCSPITLCEGSDTERSVSPSRTYLVNNYFKNTRDKIIYKAYDDISGIHFVSNQFSGSFEKPAIKGFTNYKASLTKSLNSIADSFMLVTTTRPKASIKPDPPITDVATAMTRANKIIAGTKNWYSSMVKPVAKKIVKYSCGNAEQVTEALKKNQEDIVEITLTADNYEFTSPISVYRDVMLTSTNKNPVKFSLGTADNEYMFQVVAGHALTLNNINLDLSKLNAANFIITDTSGGSGHSNFRMLNSAITNFSGTFYHAAKSTVSDSVVVENCAFENNKGMLFNFSEETDKKGYYNVEKLRIANNKITNQQGQILSMLRGGNDESTMGPFLQMTDNNITGVTSDNALITLIGSQKTIVSKNKFEDCNSDRELIRYEDFVRAAHFLEMNTFTRSGLIVHNKFVIIRKNKIAK